MSLAKILAEGAEELGVNLAPEQQQRLLDYVALLHKWNRVYNLTAVRDPEQMVYYHLLDSMAVLPYLRQNNWLDVGCGAGLPGLVLAVAKPEWSFTLLDSNSKKTSFVQQAAIDLGARNVKTYTGRVESWQPEQRFDGIISRAFAETAEFVSITRHLLAKKGQWVAMKGEPEAELIRLPAGIEVEKVIPLKVPKLNAARCLVMLKEFK